MILEILSMDSKTFNNKHLFIWGINIAHHHKYQVNSVVLVNFKEKKEIIGQPSRPAFFNKPLNPRKLFHFYGPNIRKIHVC